MLIAFAVENYRSIRDTVTLDMAAAPTTKELPDWVAADGAGTTGLSEKSLLLKAAAIYGANASGKSNVIRAFNTMQMLIEQSAAFKPDQKLPYAPFRFDKHADQPTNLSVKFIVDHTWYEYSFAYKDSGIIWETLSYRPKSRLRLIFHRESQNSQANKNTTAVVRIPQRSPLALDKSIAERVPRQSLLLSWAVQRFTGTSGVESPYRWLTETCTTLNRAPDSPFPQNDALQGAATEYLSGAAGQSKRQWMLSALRMADLGIDDVSVIERDVVGNVSALPEELASILPGYDRESKTFHQKARVMLFHHKAAPEDVRLSVGDESEGTAQFLGLAVLVLGALEHGKTLLVDEIDCSLHPDLVESILALFRSTTTNPHHAQLIFSAHNRDLLDRRNEWNAHTHALEPMPLLRRDQIWFTQKSAKGATALYPLTSFSVRQEESVRRGYRAGRYGALPVIDNEEVEKMIPKGSES